MFTLYKASAGSGKTFRLVVEYLSLCLPQPEKFKHVLAITFTNNATAEMKSRIVDTLSLFAFEPEISDNQMYKQVVAKIAPQLPENEQYNYIKIQSKKLLKAILFEYDRFSISTIDSFFQRILRAFALEFGLNAQFNLEINRDDFFNETISVLINRISKNNTHLTDLVLDLVKQQMLDKGKWKMEWELLRLLSLSMKDEVYLPLKNLKESKNNNFEQAKKKINSEKKRVKDLLKKYPSKPGKKSEDYESYMILNEQLKELDFFGRNLFQLALLFDLKVIMDEIKAQDNRFFLSETNALINEKISKEEDVPFIYEKIGNQYSYFFIDEFQDTSKLQWENIIPLIKNALSGNNIFNEQGKVFLFGDVKQAIYRFRDGNADILQQLSNIEGYKNNVVSYAIQDKDYKVELLDTNYRSSKKVVTFNNEFFNYLATENNNFEKAKDFYEDVRQNLKPDAQEGMVTVRFQEDEDKRTFKAFAPEAVLEAIRNAQQRGYEYKKIAVLVSGNDLASKIGTHLLANDIPIISVQSLQLSASLQINVAIATLQYVVSEEDRLAKLAIVHYLTQQNNLLPEEYIQYVQTERLFQQLLTDFNITINRKKLAHLPLFTLLHEIFSIYTFSIDNPFLMMLLDESENFVTQHIGTVSLFLEWWEEKGQKITLSTPQEMDAVTVSTIHKSKGLEYPVVILPFSKYRTIPTKPDVFLQDNEHITGLEYDWVTLTDKGTPERYRYKYEEEASKTLIDQLNMLYVAQTRAGRELHIITANKKIRGGNYSNFLDNFLEKDDASKNLQAAELCNNLSFSHFPPPLISPPAGDTSFSPSPLIPLFSTPFNSPASGGYLPSFPPTASHKSKAEYGIFIHNFLSALTFFPQNEKEIELIVQDLDENYREDMITIFNKILHDKSLAPYFAPNAKALNETSILFPNGNLLRPDRVVFLEGKVVVIDYKTGEAHASHKEQIDRYCEAIRDMGYEKVEGVVLYV